MACPSHLIFRQQVKVTSDLAKGQKDILTMISCCWGAFTFPTARTNNKRDTTAYVMKTLFLPCNRDQRSLISYNPQNTTH